MQSQSFMNRYLTMKREQMTHGWQLAKRNKICYLFLAPYAILFFTFFILPIATSIFYSFTYYNILEPPRFIGLQNYVNLILQDEVFLTAIKNTFVIAVVTGPFLPLCLVHQRAAQMAAGGGGGHLLCPLHRGQRLHGFLHHLPG